MRSSPSGNKGGEGEGVSGARADFVASLGRKVNDARELLALLEDDPSSKTARDELRRRLHALGAGARLLRLEAMTHSLQEALAVLDRGAQSALREQDVGFVGQVLDDLPALAWGEAPPRGAPATTHGEVREAPMPIAVLIVGDQALADALTEDAASRTRLFECERTDDPAAATELARAYAPDVLLVDVDITHAPELVEALLDDTLAEPVPVVVVGTLRSQEEIGRFVALGVSKTLPKPVAPDILRATCGEVVDLQGGRTIRMTLGEPTLEQLASRLADELKSALCDSVDRPALSHRVPLGEGTEVLGALWGAIARVQEVISQKTGGTIRFGGEAPEGAIALAPSLHQDLPGADRLIGRGRGAAADVRLVGRRVVVADDDPGVTWFVSDLLRTAGCEVYEALDGATALDLAFRVQPDLVVSDILMPGLDGFALCRALRRDVALRDTPVILLSWKEDLLQRVRELGASAAAYMRKESGSRTILARVREVLRARARIEQRLRGEGEVRGRLDDLTPRLLLELLCLVRKDARLSVRDATYLYEVDIRGGAPRKATRTASDGSYMSGERALASLLGVGAGRFAVTQSSAPIHGELAGTLFEQLLKPIAAARGALAVTGGARMTNLERILFDERTLEDYLSATPEPTRSLIKRLAQGTSPRQMLLAGDASPTLLEDVLSDLAARGAIRGVEGANGVDLLTPAIEAAHAVLRAGEAGEARREIPPNARPSASAPSRPARAASAPPAEEEKVVKPPAPAPPDDSLTPSDPPAWALDANDGVPSSLEDAVMREISDRSTERRVSRAPTSDPPPIVEPSELRPRSSNPDDLMPMVSDDTPALPSIPPDAVVPAASASEDIPAALPDVTPVESLATVAPAKEEAPKDLPEPSAPIATADPTPPARFVRPSRRKVWPLAAIGLLGGAVVAVLRIAGEKQEPPARATSGVPATAESTAAAAEAPSSVASASSSNATDDLPLGAEVPAGFGLIEVRSPPRAVVRVDGKVAGSGTFVASVAKPGYHDVRVEQGGRSSTHVIEVRVGKVTQVRSALLP
jgi:DNA-binding response OmpR family regulator